MEKEKIKLTNDQWRDLVHENYLEVDGLSIEFTEVQGKKAEKIYLNREQVIELINKINEDAIKDGIKLHEMNQETNQDSVK